MKTTKNLFDRRQQRVRTRLKKLSGNRPRLSVFRSNQHIYAQVIDDAKGVTLAAASSLEKSMRETLKSGADKSAAEQVGSLIAKRAIDAGVTEVVFDRGGYHFHGRVKSLADAVREGGLTF
ncbi:MAG: 50S ribosomal protein L18 [Proteobacteria bacterium]|nr:50S ribosomal protein L18 [Pseudomonadota bacterium]